MSRSTIHRDLLLLCGLLAGCGGPQGLTSNGPQKDPPRDTSGTKRDGTCADVATRTPIAPGLARDGQCTSDGDPDCGPSESLQSMRICGVCTADADCAARPDGRCVAVSSRGLATASYSLCTYPGEPCWDAPARWIEEPGAPCTGAEVMPPPPPPPP